ncbi:MAG: IS4 family transposase [Pyrinomonadaceae bacterium]|nr:IS4 family transposase [Phycisphaerales bacterium]
METFSQALSERVPLALAVLELFDHVFDERLLDSIYEADRGRCYTDTLTFSQLIVLVRDALVHHQGSGHQMFTQLVRNDAQPVDESNFYRKLQRMPVLVSRALLRTCSRRMAELMPTDAVSLPDCFASFRAVVIDGKKIKNAAKRLELTRGFSGSLIGAKALVAMDARHGLALAMSDSLDGLTNDLPLVESLVPQVLETIGVDPILWMADRQFGNVKTFQKLSGRPIDRFVIRIQKGLPFKAISRRETIDEQGRKVIDETGVFGNDKQSMPVRRITLERPGEKDDVILVTDLLDEQMYPACELLKLYRHRWGIEQMFQQVTETFALDHLIGCAPQAILFQFALCLLMYNLIQVVKSFVAEDGNMAMLMVSTYGLFYDVKRELGIWAYLGDGCIVRTPRTAQQMRNRLRKLLHDSWDAVAYLKASDKKPRKKRPPPKRLHGGHTSTQRLLEGRAKVIQ